MRFRIPQKGVIILKIVCCYKVVPCSEGIQVNPDHTLSFAKADIEIGQYDLIAAQVGVQLKSDVPDSKVIAVTVGGANVNNSKMKKAILARGPDEMFGVMDENLEGIDSFATATLVKAAVEKLGGADLIICGEGSSDIYNQQMGNMLGQMMGVPVLNSVCKVTPTQGGLIVERNLETEVEEMEIPFPAVISVNASITRPRIASLKDIMAAGKKPMTVWSLADLGVTADSRVAAVSTLAPQQSDRKRVIIEGEDEDSVSEFYEYLRKSL